MTFKQLGKIVLLLSLVSVLATISEAQMTTNSNMIINPVVSSTNTLGTNSAPFDSSTNSNGSATNNTMNPTNSPKPLPRATPGKPGPTPTYPPRAVPTAPSAGH